MLDQSNTQQIFTCSNSIDMLEQAVECIQHLVIRHQKVGLMKVSTCMILGFKLPFSVFFSLSNCWKRSIFNSIRNTSLFDALEDWPIVLPISVKIGMCRAIKFDMEVELLEV